jgi:signal transduction histidine kinase
VAEGGGGSATAAAHVESLLRTIEELRVSRARIAESAQQERLRLERNLHDGAQQRLLAIQIKLEAARERAGGELARELEEVAADASAAVEDLRALAHGLYPAVLHEQGLGVALRSIAYEAAIRVDVDDRAAPRCSPSVEEAVYFTALQAVQNATKHAGRGARVTITLEPSTNGLAFAVADDGAGFDPARPGDEGIGIVSMRDRIGAVGGELTIVSAPGQGTTVRGAVPLRALGRPEDGSGSRRG